MTNSLNWFEIPVNDFVRAKMFYEAIYGSEIQEIPFPDGLYGMFPCDMGSGVGGGIVKGDGYEPSATGTIVYLNGGEDLDIPLARVEAAGGKIIFPKTSIGENGFMAHIMDTEGNRIALHSMN